MRIPAYITEEHLQTMRSQFKACAGYNVLNGQIERFVGEVVTKRMTENPERFSKAIKKWALDQRYFVSVGI